MKARVDQLNRIIRDNLCIGCGCCATMCPEQAIEMQWARSGVWIPSIREKSCTDCGMCYTVCPQSPKALAECATRANRHGRHFGLQKENSFYISYDSDAGQRIKSASGGTFTVLLQHLLETKRVDGIITSFPLSVPFGKPHFEIRVANSMKELGNARSSHYHPLCYYQAITKVLQEDGTFALIGLPCVIRGVKQLPSRVREKISYMLAPVCSHNVTAQFTDCMAKQEGIAADEAFLVNLRDKHGGIPDANNFNNVFESSTKTIRRNRFRTSFTDLWRNYFFACEGCLYCPDFYGADADLSIKDAWGRLSKDPLGISLVVCRNKELGIALEELKQNGRIYLETTNAEEIYNSQQVTAVFKHEHVRDRMVWKSSLREELVKTEYPIKASRRWWRRQSWEYLRLKATLQLSKHLFARNGHTSITAMVFLMKVFRSVGKIKKYLFGSIMKGISIINRTIKYLLKTIAYFTGIKKRRRVCGNIQLRVLIAGGYGYGNIGDEAQLAANIQHWKKAVPTSRITVLTPNIEYTCNTHPGVQVELAPRRALFGWRGRQYCGSQKTFKRLYFPLAALLFFNTCLIRAGLPVFGLSARQARMLEALNSSDVLFLSGGGYLTGMTLTRLWDNMLLINLAHALGVPVILSGQTIGVFRDRVSTFLAKWGLKKAELIYLRDHEGSVEALKSIKINFEKFKSTFDDALFFEPAKRDLVLQRLRQFNIGINQPYVAVNVHNWGQSKEASKIIMQQVASALDHIQSELDIQIVFVPMVKTDEVSIQAVAGLMHSPSFFPQHNYDPSLAVGLICNASLCLTMKHHPIIFAMGGGVPAVSMTFDDYYYHKNFGAHKIFGQEKWIVSCEPEKLCDNIFIKVRDMFFRRDEISQDIKNKIETLRPEAGEVIYRWFDSEKQQIIN